MARPGGELSVIELGLVGIASGEFHHGFVEAPSLADVAVNDDRIAGAGVYSGEDRAALFRWGSYTDGPACLICRNSGSSGPRPCSNTR